MRDIGYARKEPMPSDNPALILILGIPFAHETARRDTIFHKDPIRLPVVWFSIGSRSRNRVVVEYQVRLGKFVESESGGVGLEL